MDRLRYIVPDDVIGLAAELSLHEEKEVRDKALQVVSGYSGYDFRVLPQIGYLPQRKMTDFLLAWSEEERIRHIDFVEAAATELLSASVGGEEMTAVDTLTIRFGQVTPTEFLKKIRTDVLNLVYELFKVTDDTKVKLRLVQVLDTHAGIYLQHWEEVKASFVIQFIPPLLSRRQGVADEAHGELPLR